MFPEIKRVFLHRGFGFILLLIAGVNILLFSLLCVEDLDFDTTSLREEYLSAYRAGTMTEEEMADYQAELEVVLTFFAYVEEEQADEEFYRAYYAQEYEALREAYPQLAQDFDNGVYQKEEVQCTYGALTQVLETIQTGDSYREYISSVVEKADQMGSMAVFETNESQQAIISLTKDTFSSLESLEVSFGNDLPVTKIANYALEYLIGIVAVFLLLQKMTEERRWGLRPVIFCASNGRLRLALRRAAVTVVISAVVSAVLSLSTVASAVWFYGSMDLSRLVQSIPAFYDFTWVMTIGEFLLIRWGIMTLNLAVMSACIWMLCSFFQDARIAFLLYVGIVGISAFLYTVIPLISAVGWLKYVNIYSGLVWMEYGLSYYLLPFFRISVDRLSFVIVIQCCFLLGLLSGGFAVNTRKRPISSPHFLIERIARIFNRINSKWHALVGRLSYRGTDWYRLAISRRGIVVAVVFVYLITRLYPFETTISVGKARVLDEYYQSIGGVLTEDTDAWLEEMEETFASVDADFEESQRLFEEDLISLADYQQAVLRYEAFAIRREAYEDIYQQIQYLKEQAELGYDGWLIDDDAYNLVFEGQSSSDRTALFLMLLVILWIVWTLNVDRHDKKTFAILKTTPDGLRRLGRLKMSQAVVCVTIIYALFTAMNLMSIQTSTGFDAITAPAHSLELFASLPINPPLWVMLVLWFALALLPTLALAGLFCAISASPAGLAAFIPAGSLIVLPDILYLLGYETVQKWTSWNRASVCAKALVNGQNWLLVAVCLLLFPASSLITSVFWRDKKIWNYIAKKFGKTMGR